MIEVQGNLWTYPVDYRCVTTNGVVKKNGELVMGAGVALEASNLYPELSKRLGDNVSIFGNIPFIIHDYKIISFPTKYHWKDNSDLSLIIKSAKEIVTFANVHNIGTIGLTRPGCGMGKLDWNIVQQALSPILDNRFIVIHKYE